jgi:hypothetical protein
LSNYSIDQQKALALASARRRRAGSAVAQPEAPKERGWFEDTAQGGGNVLTQRGIGIIQLLDEATGGAILSDEARQASYKASQNLQKEQENLGTLGKAANITADPLMALPFAKGLQGVKALAATGAVSAGLSGALKAKTSEEEDRLAGTGLEAGVGAIAGPIVGKALEAVTSPVQTAKNVASGLGRAMKVSPESVKIFEEAGLSPLVGDVSNSARVQRFQNMAEDTPFVGSITTGAKERLSKEVKNKLTAIGFDEASERVIGGNAAKQGLTNYVTKGKKLFNNAFDKFDEKYINKSEPVEIQSTISKIDDIMSRADTPEALDAYLGSTEKSIMSKIKEASAPTINKSNLLDSNGLPIKTSKDIIGAPSKLTYNDLKLFRTSIGKKLEDYTIGSSDKATLRELYQAMTDDMRRKAMSRGEETLQAFDRLNKGYGKFITKLDDTVNDVLNKGETTEIFNAIRSGLPLPERTAAIMNSLQSKNRDILRGSLIKEIGTDRAKAGQGEFNVSKFVTGFNALDNKAQNALLIGLPKDVQNNFRKVMESATLSLKTGLQSNPSGTAKNAGLAFLLGSMWAAPLTTTAGLTGGAITAKMMTSPKFIKWLANAPKQTDSTFTKYVAKLSAIAAADEANKEDIENFQQQIGATQ